jgi:hypothetical protein
MSTFTAVANFNGQKPVIAANDSAMLLIDHQSGLFQTVKVAMRAMLNSHSYRSSAPCYSSPPLTPK